MDITFKIDGLDALKKNCGVTVDNVEKQVLIALDASALHIADEAKRSIRSGQKSGRVYHRRTVTHQASAPGEAPASDTGRLVNSIATYVVKNGMYALVTAGAGLAKYAVMLEYGTRKMLARPFFFPAVERSRQWIQARLNEAVTRAIKASGKK